MDPGLADFVRAPDDEQNEASGFDPRADGWDGRFC
jgi:hypothetical protein